MKNFKDLLSEVAQPKSAEEKRFKDQHTIELIKHPVALDSQFTGEIEGVTKEKRLADPAEGEDAAKYDAAYSVKDKPFKMPRDIDESVEELDEAEFSQWSVEIPAQHGLEGKHKVTVKARNSSEAVKKAASRVGMKDRWMSMKIGKVTKLGMAEEVEEIDEISKKTLGSYINKASKSAAHSSGMAYRRFSRGTRADDRAGDELEKKSNKRLAGIATATKKLTKEEADQLDEISAKLARKAAAASSAKSFEYGNYAYDDESGKEADRLSNKADKAYAHVMKRQGQRGVDKTNRLAGKLIYGKSRYMESAEELEEKSVSQAQQKLMGMALALKRGEMDAADASDEVKKLAKDMSMKDLEDFASTKHKGLPVKKESFTFKDLKEKLATEQDLLENPQEEIPMMMRQLEFIAYAADEIMEYLAIDGLDPEEWWQNKLAYAFAQMKSLHAYIEGDKRVMGFGDDDDTGMMASYESVQEEIEEGTISFEAGEFFLENNDTVTLSEEDAETLSVVFDSLDEENREQMYTIMIEDAESFQDVLEFAKEVV